MTWTYNADNKCMEKVLSSGSGDTSAVISISAESLRQLLPYAAIWGLISKETLDDTIRALDEYTSKQNE